MGAVEWSPRTVKDLRPLDLDELTRQERSRLDRELRAAATPEQLCRLAGRIARDAKTEADQLRDPVYDLAIHLHQNERYRNVAAAIGLRRNNYLHRLIQTRAPVQFPSIPNAVQELVELGERYARLEIRGDLAEGPRNRAILELLAAGWSRKDVADLAQVVVSRVGHIANPPKRRVSQRSSTAA